LLTDHGRSRLHDRQRGKGLAVRSRHDGSR
jgi:hypothetical protein